MAYHVLDIICQMMKSSEKGAFERVDSTCGRYYNKCIGFMKLHLIQRDMK